MAILFVVLLLAGCAMKPAQDTRYRKADFMKERFAVFGAYKTELVGSITWKDDNECNEAAFVFYVRQKKMADRLVDIVTEEICSAPSPGSLDEDCSCDYSGIGLNYKQLEVEEASLWGNVASLEGVESNKEKENPPKTANSERMSH